MPDAAVTSQRADDFDTVVIFVDDAGVEYAVASWRLGHTDREVRAVAYRWACHKIDTAEWHPYGEIRFRSLRPAG